MTILKGKKALLLAEACKLSKEKKAMDKRIDEIKKDLNLEKGSYQNEANDALTISESDKMAPIPPRKVFLHMKKNGLLPEYWKCVKVQLKELRSQLSESTVKKWERKVGTTKRYTFK